MLSRKFKKEMNKIGALAIITTTAIPLSSNLINNQVQATDYSSESSALKAKMNNLLKQENELKAKIYDARSQLMKTNSSISNAEIKISDLNNQKTTANDKLTDLNSEIKSTKAVIDKENKSLSAIYQGMQENSNDDSAVSKLADLIPGVAKKKASVTDAASSTVKSLKKQLKKDTDKLTELKSEKQDTVGKITDLTNQINAQQKAKKDMQNNLDSNDFVKNSFDPAKMAQVQNLQDQHDRLQRQFNHLTDDVISHTNDSTKKQLEAQKKDLKGIQGQVNNSSKNLNQITGKEMDNLKVNLNQINQAIDQAGSNSGTSASTASTGTDSASADVDLTPTSTNNTATQKALVKLILKQVGKPYIWGGEDPNSGFDCSGLTQYVFRTAAGINLPRVSQDQCILGKNVPVDSSHLRAGDLVFWGSPAHHVAMMINDHLFVQAPEPGQNVKITDISWYKPDYAKRILNNN